MLILFLNFERNLRFHATFERIKHFSRLPYRNRSITCFSLPLFFPLFPTERALMNHSVNYSAVRDKSAIRKERLDTFQFGIAMCEGAQS